MKNKEKNRTLKQTTKTIIILITILIITLLTTKTVTAGQFLVNGYAKGDCYENAQLNVTIYDQGFLNDPAHIADSFITTAAADGSYGQISGLLADNTYYDINVTATNPSCSPGAIGSAAATNQQTGGAFDPPTDVKINITITAPFYNTNPGNNTITGNNQTTFNWTSDYTGIISYNLIIANDTGFTQITRNITGITGTGYTLTPGEALSNGIYYWRVEAKNGSTTKDTTEYYRVQIAAGEAIITNTNPANGTWIGGTTQLVTIQTDKDATCKYATSPGISYDSKITFSSTGGTTHTTTMSLGNEGANHYYIQCNTTTGQLNAQDYEYILMRDTTPPSAASATVTIENGSQYSTDTTIDFNWSGFTDTGSGITNYYYSFTNNGGTTSGTSDPASPGQLTGANQGTVTVYVWAEDAVGNIGQAASDTIIVDSLPPSFGSWSTIPYSLTKYSTGDFRVDVAITDTSPLSGTPQYRYRIGNDAWSNWSSMTLLGSSGNTFNYYFIIPEQASPNTWFERAGENLTYETSATDVHGFQNNVTRNEFIDDQASAPILTPIPDMLIYEKNTTTFNLTATDADMDSLTYTCNISGATITKINDNLATVTWTPTNNDVGTKTYECNVTDGIFTVSDTFTVTVINVNDPPELSPIGNLYAQEYVFFNYTLNATDPDNDLLIFGSNSTIFSVNSITGKIAFTPLSYQRGTYQINFTVTDGKGGEDYESVLFTVGYCGDGVCKEGYETCGTCETDCGTCEPKESQAIIVEPRNCLGEETYFQAVKLVPRATCEEEGQIIDGMEVCGNLSDQTLTVYYEVEGSWEETTTLITDDSGYASFVPEEKGTYKVSLGDAFETFEVNECLGTGSLQETTSSGKQTGTETGELPKPPVIEEPTTTTIEETKNTLLIIFFYFILSPLLLLGVVISGLAFVYKLEKQKPTSNYVKTIDSILERTKNKIRKTKEAITTKIILPIKKWAYSKPYMVKTIKEFNKATTTAKDYWESLKKLTKETIINQWIALGGKKTINFKTYDLQVKGKKWYLLFLALVKHKNKKTPLAKILETTMNYKIQSLEELAAALISLKIKTRMISKSIEKPEIISLLIKKGLRFRQREGTRIDLESSIITNQPPICLIHEKVGNKIIETAVIVYGFDKNYFYYHDALRGIKNLVSTKDEFIKKWRKAGSKAIFID